jgi:hypothetical protein
MGYWDAIVGDIKPTLTGWLTCRGGSVSDLPLSLINRAIQKLWIYKPWDFLIKTGSLTVSNLSATLPADFGRVIELYHDSDSDGRPDWYYFRNDKKIDHRYTLLDSFDKTTGHSWAVTFPTTPTSTPILKYQKILSAVSTDAHYLFFPANLVLRAAQVEHIVEKGISGVEADLIIKDFKEQLIDFEQVCQHSNNAPITMSKDSQGDELQTEGYGLDGAVGRQFSPHSNSYDR